MNFKDFYNKTEQRIQDSVLSLWATGDKEMQDYFRYLLENEKIMAKPVFQNMFPWKSAPQTFGELDSLFQKSFIQKLDGIKIEDFKFPINRHPYIHQIESWEASLLRKKSILVTTGTGSGKTECFMLPVLQDIYQNSPNKIGVNAIFLYPLNALIGSQKKRMQAWCKSLGNIKFAVYNGSTKETVPAESQNKAFPEIISRKEIRSTPPQILFTNPTMLEYMLVRDKDVDLLNQSQGTLRWILLDEAHTLTGSKAAEMALLIRRVIDAFGVNIDNVRFAVTSATVGASNDDKLKQFMAELCGIKFSSIEIIKGNRELPSVDYSALGINQPKATIINNLRITIYSEASISSDEIRRITNKTTLPEQLDFMDEHAEIFQDGQSILPVRGHFFSRNITGVYACTNPACNVSLRLSTHL